MAITETYHPQSTIDANVASGSWTNRTLDDYLVEHAARQGDKLCMVDRKWRLTYAELERLAHRVACGLYQLGIRPGDVISMQLPNWAEWLIVHCAASKIGAVTNSIGAVYRHKEVEYIVRYAETKLLVIPDVYRRFSHADMVAELWPALPDLAHVLVVGDTVPSAMRPFVELLEKPWEDEVERAQLSRLRPDPNQIVTLMFTSGTTADPKGVMHTHNTINTAAQQLFDAYGMNGDDVLFMASPIGHTTALLVGARSPVVFGATTVWQEHWDAEEAIEMIAREGCTFTLSATPFLHGLVNAPNATREKLATLRTFACGGAPIPRELIKQADAEFGLFVSALYGSSEALVNTAVGPGAPEHRRYGTDGQVIPGVEAKLVALDTGEPPARPPGPDGLPYDLEEGELLVRTPALYAGYYKDEATTRSVCSPDGWYATGDICTLDDEGYVNVVGRKKDMIIRGGANISAREIEELLFTHPKVAVVACVAMPDPVLAERVCAYVVCEQGQRLEFEEMVAFLKTKRVSAWKLPERLEIRDEFPMTPSGKVQKYQLRGEIAGLLEHERRQTG